MRIRPLPTPRMTVRPMEGRDRREFVRVHEVSEALFAPWSPRRPPNETLEHLFEAELDKGSRETHLRLVGVLPDQRIAGFFNLGEIVRGVFESAYAAWRTNWEVARQGYGTEGVTALLDIAFSSSHGLGLHRVQANVIPDNLPSIRLAERVGFRREGLALNYLKIAGSWRDHLMFAKLADEHRVTYLGNGGPS